METNMKAKHKINITFSTSRLIRKIVWLMFGSFIKASTPDKNNKLRLFIILYTNCSLCYIMRFGGGGGKASLL